jgi:hypothetical protein
MPPVGFESTIAAGERPKTYALDRAATGTGRRHFSMEYFHIQDVFDEQLDTYDIT